MAKTLNHYSQQIRSLAPDALALDRAKALGDLLIDAKAAVKAAGKLWGEWLQSDCDLSPRNAGRFMTIAKRWNEQAFTQARETNPKLAIREADKVLAASSPRKRAEPEQRDPYNEAMSKLAILQFELQLLSEMTFAAEHAALDIRVAEKALQAVYKKLDDVHFKELCTSIQATQREKAVKEAGPIQGVTINTGPIHFRDELKDTPKEKWAKVFSERRLYLPTEFKYACRNIVKWLAEAEEFHQELGYESADEMLKEEMNVEPDWVRMAVAVMKAERAREAEREADVARVLLTRKGKGRSGSPALN